MSFSARIVLIVIGACFAPMLFSCTPDIKKVKLLTDFSSEPTLHMVDAEIVNSDSGFVQMVLHAPVLNRYDQKEEPYVEFPSGVDIRFYDRNKHEISSLKANYSRIDEKKNIWIARHNVEAINRKNEKLNTEYLVWDRNNKTFFTDHVVKITNNEGTIYGDGLTANEDLTRWKLINPKGTITINE